MKCKHCGATDKITLVDHQPLATSHTHENAKENQFFLENEVYATARCWSCETDFEVIANINFIVRDF